MTFSFFALQYLKKEAVKAGLQVTEKELALVFKALSDENRIRIINYLWDGEKTARRLLAVMDISQSTLSHHMKILCDSGIVIGRRVGTFMIYKVSPEGVKVMQDFLAYLARSRTICLEKQIYDEPCN